MGPCQGTPIKKWHSKIQNGDIIADEKQIVNVFNDYFVSMIRVLKDNIDTIYDISPLPQLVEDCYLSRGGGG